MFVGNSFCICNGDIYIGFSDYFDGLWFDDCVVGGGCGVGCIGGGDCMGWCVSVWFV